MNIKYIGMDVHKKAISIAVMNDVGKLVKESIIETKAVTILQFIQGLRGDLYVTFEEGTWATWLFGGQISSDAIGNRDAPCCSANQDLANSRSDLTSFSFASSARSAAR